MSHTPKYSVIIPVYNAEDTLRRCLDSLIRQPFTDFEILLVNDGSQDGSEGICREYAELHRHVRYLSKPNGGVSSARNAGLGMACGTYVLFVDSDDYVPDDLFATLEELDREGPWDLILGASCRTDGQSVSLRRNPEARSRNAEETARLLAMAYCRKTINQPWAKRYRLELIRTLDLRFHEGLSIGEDKLFNLQYALSCSSCRFTEKPIYYVNTGNENSLSRKPRPDGDPQFLLLDGELRQVLRRQDIDQSRLRYFREAENFLRCRSVYARAKRMRRSGADRPERLRMIRSQCRELNAAALPVPRSCFCLAVCLPIRLRMAWVIDLVAGRLAG